MQSHINVGYGRDITISQLTKTVGQVVGYQCTIDFDAPKATLATGRQIASPLQFLIGRRVLALLERRVMLDAELYGVQAKVLVQAVKRSFPQDFMFQLTLEEFAALMSQTVTSNTEHGGRRTAPYAFSEQGVGILSLVLGSQRAIGVNTSRSCARSCVCVNLPQPIASCSPHSMTPSAPPRAINSNRSSKLCVN
jgi:hypothetical protein